MVQLPTHQKRDLPDFTATELARAKAQGLELKDTTDASGIHRRYFVREKNGAEIFEGPVRSWFAGGKPRRNMVYREGLAEGPFCEWYPDGGIQREGRMHRNQQEGPWRFWRKNGTRLRESTYRGGVLDGRCTYFHLDERKAAEGRYRGGLQEGEWALWGNSVPMRRLTFHEGLAMPFSTRRHKGLPPPVSGGTSTRLDIRVDARLELLAVVQSFTDWTKFGPWATPGEPYVKAVEAWFRPYKDHPAIKKYAEILGGGTNFAFDGPPSVLLHFSDPPALTPLVPVRPDLLKRAGGAAQLDSLMALLRDFVRDSRFEAFFAAQQPFYRGLIADYHRVSPGLPALELLQNHYGETRSAFTIAISPLIGGANYGPQIDEPTGSHIYNIGAPAFSSGGKYTFSLEWVRPMIFHEFGHSFANAIVAAYPSFSNYGATLFPPVEERMKAQAYGSWETMLNELFVRTNEVRLLELYGAAREARRMQAEYVQLGFLWLPYTLARLNEFESDRKKYPRFYDFFPQIESSFQQTELFFAGGEAVFVIPRNTA